MDQEELLLYEAFANHAIDNLFWSLSYINNVAFNTPMKTDIQKKLINLNQAYELLISGIYPAEKGQELIRLAASHNQLFIAYVDHLFQNSGQTAQIKQKWKENGQQIAQALSKMNHYWMVAEWAAMINHESDLLETIAINMKDKKYMTFINTAPVCRRLAIDMSKYMCGGITKQRQDTWNT